METGVGITLEKKNKSSIKGHKETATVEVVMLQEFSKIVPKGKKRQT